MRTAVAAFALLAIAIPLPALGEKFLIKKDESKYLGTTTSISGKFIACDGTLLSIEAGDKVVDTTEVCPIDPPGPGVATQQNLEPPPVR
jgi:hypothetical protein